MSMCKQPGSAKSWIFVALAFGLWALTVLHAPPAFAKAKRRLYNPPQAAFIIDANTGKVLYQQNPDAARFPASLTKVMTLYLLFERLKGGKIDLNTPLRVSAHAASRPPSKLGLKPGDTIPVEDAIRALVTKSANDVASTVAENLASSEAAFARLMTEKARSFGMTNTTFRNASGLPNSQQRTTARDLVLLGQRIMTDFPKLSVAFKRRYFAYHGRRYKNHNHLLFNYAGTEGIKTGYVRASGFNLLASARRGKKHLIAVVMGGRSSRRRDARMRTLLNQCWRKAAAQTVVARATMTELPERNPAFHASKSEIAIRKALVAALQAHEERTAPGRQLKPAGKAERAAQLAAFIKAESAALPGRNRPAGAVDEGDANEAQDNNAEAGGRAPVQLAGPYQLQVGSYVNADDAKYRLATLAGRMKKLLGGHDSAAISADVSGQTMYRARFGGFSASAAKKACQTLRRSKIDCMVAAAE